jgi:Mn2+/Fe2+ NRAMP family transporter
VPVLAGSSSFAIAEMFGWRAGLDLSPRRGRRFYLVFAGAVLAGMALDLAGTNPIRMLVFSAVLNGLLAPPLLVLVMLISRDRAIMGRHANGPWLTLLGWSATAVMSLAALAFFATSW